MSSNTTNEENRLNAAKELYSRLCDGAVLCQLHLAIEEVIEAHFDESLEDYVHSDESSRERHVFHFFVFLEELVNGTDITVEGYVANYIENLS
jgi:hypothetical protein